MYTSNSTTAFARILYTWVRARIGCACVKLISRRSPAGSSDTSAILYPSIRPSDNCQSDVFFFSPRTFCVHRAGGGEFPLAVARARFRDLADFFFFTRRLFPLVTMFTVIYQHDVYLEAARAKIKKGIKIIIIKKETSFFFLISYTRIIYYGFPHSPPRRTESPPA